MTSGRSFSTKNVTLALHGLKIRVAMAGWWSVRLVSIYHIVINLSGENVVLLFARFRLFVSIHSIIY